MDEECLIPGNLAPLLLPIPPVRKFPSSSLESGVIANGIATRMPYPEPWTVPRAMNQPVLDNSAMPLFDTTLSEERLKSFDSQPRLLNPESSSSLKGPPELSQSKPTRGQKRHAMPLDGSLGCMRWLQLARNPAAAAALGLVTIQVGFGLVMKAAQSDGAYSFSPSASVSISELLKMVLAAALFHRECRKRLAAGISPEAEPRYLALPSASTPEKTPSVGPPRLGLAAFWGYFRNEVSEDEQGHLYVLALCYALINNSVRGSRIPCKGYKLKPFEKRG